MKPSFVDEIRSGAKGASLKVEIIRYYILHGKNTIAELSKELNLSVPTVTKLVSELMDDGYVADFGICTECVRNRVILWELTFATLE